MSFDAKPRVCVYGAGAVGGHIATRLAQGDQCELSVVARGEHLRAIRADGLHLRHVDGGSWQARPAHATDDAGELPAQDLVLVGLKAHALPAHAQALGRLLAPDGVVVFLTNGIPWWWQHGLAQAEPLTLLDPDGALWRALGPERVLGAVVYSSNEVEAPGRVLHRGKNRFILGEPNGTLSPRLVRVVQLLQASGIHSEASAQLRTEVWRKLLFNASGNPVSALTRLGTVERVGDPALLGLCRQLVQEVALVAAASGWPVHADDLAQAGSATPVASARPSMLQDVLLSRPLEVEAILGQPQRFAREHGVDTPALDVVLALLRGLARAQTLS
ncbi:ketopantoate reductase family protein [Hydrogenophaga sp.]|uniref:ketopantoate reductase family protein n=1 Tax=Hydrogenophaga sp. TaxID=1904254 RepID=UPI00271FD659|nr:2-dehydropantoate 2-reductase [Hydrogenophaga sp.]MDO9437860.1 2-dehydropantoate 2-reductase [Hydrogenophaga sp.]